LLSASDRASVQLMGQKSPAIRKDNRHGTNNRERSRLGTGMAQRRATFPLDSYDVPVDQLIVRGGGTGPQMAIDPKAQKKLVDGLLGDGNAERYRLGDIKQSQANDVMTYGNGARTNALDVWMTPSTESHIQDGRTIFNNITPQKTGLHGKQAMYPDSDVQPPFKKGDFPALMSKQFFDNDEKKLYNAMMPLRTVDDGFEVVSIIPKGLRGKNKTPKK